MLRLPLSAASPFGARARLSVLIFHRVLAEPDALLPDLPDAVEFEQKMRWVRDWFQVMPLAAAVERLYRGDLPARALAITFDDGYADNAEIAAPILERLGMTATVFVTTGYLGDGCMWNDAVIDAVRRSGNEHLDAGDLAGLDLGRLPLATMAQRRSTLSTLLSKIKHLEPEQRQQATQAIVRAAGTGRTPALMMTRDQVVQLRNRGMDIGAHTVTHPILSRMDAASALSEIRAGKQQLESIIDAPVDLFAYPNGVPMQDYTAEHVRMVRECGFTAAVSTAWGAAAQRSDRYQLPRFTPWDRSRLRFGGRLLANFRHKETIAA